jgi:dynein intermediate chain 1
MPTKAKKGAKGKKKRDEREVHEESHDFSVPETKVVVPTNQVHLDDKQKDEEITRVITANDPNAPANRVVYHFKDREFKTIPPGAEDNIVFHFSMDGHALHRESDEAKVQVMYERDMREAAEEKRKEMLKEAAAEGKELDEESAVDGSKNQFNYSQRATQTYNLGTRTKAVSTEPPECRQFSATVTQWDIYDSYMHELSKTQAEDGSAALEVPEASKRTGDVIHSDAMGRSLKMMERMVNQNAEDEIYMDFKYWEDASDQFRDGEGSLLPLWRFADARTRRKQVTALSWNPSHRDLFAVAYGSYDFMKQGSGLICVYTLKNTSHPEFTFTTESGVMCLAWHPQHRSLLAVGCYDGTVKVFDVRKRENRPIFDSNIRTGKHTDPVWEVRWAADDTGKDLGFFSISSDGRVASWVLSKNELKMEPVMTLKLVSAARGEMDDETSLTGLAGGCCFDFHHTSEHLFVVGTEEGKIHKCSKAYSGQYLETYEGHHMAVYAVRWNPFHPRVFLSCSADWTVKLWDHTVPTPIMTFDLSNAVGDISWAPYSSTVFSAVTSDGKVHVYDLDVNKHEQLCEQKVVKRARLTHVVFNDTNPMLLVGDDRGGVNSLKLSPNLRKITEIPVPEQKKGEPPVEPPSREEVEIGKMDKLLAAADTPTEASGGWGGGDA